MNEKKSFYVIGMSCAGCAANIQQALSERKGVMEDIFPRRSIPTERGWRLTENLSAERNLQHM